MQSKTMTKKAMTIAGSDSGGGAGIQADLKTFAALGVYGTSAITAITAQNTLKVTDVLELPPGIVAAQIDAIVSDIGADAVKTGMLANASIIEVVADRVRQYGLQPLVIDPVMVAKSGDPLLRQEAVDALRTLLLPLATVVTPNIPEAETILGHSLDSDEAIRDAARTIVALGARSVVIKGGHRESPTADDLFYDGEEFRVFSAPRVNTANTHGTGCTFASAIAAWLARDADLATAVARAKDYITHTLSHAYSIGHGHSPVHHFYHLWPRMAEE